MEDIDNINSEMTKEVSPEDVIQNNSNNTDSIEESKSGTEDNFYESDEQLFQTSEENNSDNDIEDSLSGEEEAESIKPKKKQLWKENRKKYAALAENEKLKQELAQERQARQETEHSAMLQHAEGVISKFNDALAIEKEALASGDMDKYQEARLNLNAKHQDYMQLQNYVNSLQNQQNTPQEDNQGGMQDALVYQEIASDWIEHNPEVNPHSKKYNKKLAESVSNFVGRLDNECHQGNVDFVLYSPAYFEAIENYMGSVKSNYSTKSNRPIYSDNVSGVKNSSHSNKQTVTQSDIEGAEIFGVTPEEFMKSRLKSK